MQAAWEAGLSQIIRIGIPISLPAELFFLLKGPCLVLSSVQSRLRRLHVFMPGWLWIQTLNLVDEVVQVVDLSLAHHRYLTLNPGLSEH